MTGFKDRTSRRRSEEAVAIKQMCISKLSLMPHLSDETSPEAIRAKHKREIKQALVGHKKIDVAQLSQELYLPVWNIKRALSELGWIEVEGFWIKDFNRKDSNG